jgi:hypothetical protein
VVWLLPTLKEKIFDKLYSQSGKFLKIVNRDLSCSQLHRKCNLATPHIFSLYPTCINYYNIMNALGHRTDEKTRVLMHTMQSNRNDFFVFIWQKQYKCGLNTISNCLQSVTNIIKKNGCLWTKLLLKLYVKNM